MSKWIWIGLIFLVVIIIGIFAWNQYQMTHVKEPSFSILKKQGNIETREYAPYLTAEVDVKGERKDAINRGFRILAAFIFGGNSKQNDIDMTAPVIQTAGEQISMTAPVIQQGNQDLWKVSFVMPAEYTEASLPKPKNADIKIISHPTTKMIAIKFSGRATTKNVEKHQQKLLEYIADNNLAVKSQAIYAFYNPPWVLPFLKRNEVMFQLVD